MIHNSGGGNSGIGCYSTQAQVVQDKTNLKDDFLRFITKPYKSLQQVRRTHEITHLPFSPKQNSP